MKITPDSVILEDVKTSMLTTLPADNVVLSMGVRPVGELYRALEGRLERVYEVGDANTSGTIADAVHSAYEVAVNIH